MAGLFAQLFQSAQSENNEALWSGSEFISRHLAAGEPVGDTSALTLSTWFAILRNQSEDVAKLPCHVINYTSETTKERVNDHPVARLMTYAPNAYQDPINFKSQMTHFLLGWGNAYAEIERDSRMRPIALHPLHPGRVKPEWDETGTRLQYRVLLDYQFTNGRLKVKSERVIDQDNMFHLRGLGSDPLQGYSVIRMAAESLSAALAVERFGAAYFKNSGALSGIVKYPGALDDEDRAFFVDSFNQAYGGARRTGGWILLEDGMTYEQLSINPEDAQFLQTRILAIEDICRWLRMPPSKVQHLAKANYNSLEMQNLEYVIDSLMSITTKWQEQGKRKLFDYSEAGYYLDFNFHGWLKGDIKAQTEHIVKMVQNGIYTPNQGLSFLGLNTIGPEGDQRFIAVNMQPLKPNMQSPQESRQQRAEMELSKPAEPEPVVLNYDRAKSFIEPIINWTRRKNEKAVERLNKKHEGDEAARDAALMELTTDNREEMKRNVLEFWKQFSEDEAPAIMTIENGEPRSIDFDLIVDKLASLLAKGQAQ